MHISSLISPELARLRRDELIRQAAERRTRITTRPRSIRLRPGRHG